MIKEDILKIEKLINKFEYSLYIVKDISQNEYVNKNNIFFHSFDNKYYIEFKGERCGETNL